MSISVISKNVYGEINGAGYNLGISSAQENDVVIAIIAQNSYSNPVSAPSTAGYTEILLVDHPTANYSRLGIYYKVQGSTPDTIVSWADTGISALARVFTNYVLRGVDINKVLVADVEWAYQLVAGVDFKPNPPSIESLGDGAFSMVVGLLPYSANTLTAPTGYSELAFYASNDSFDVMCATAIKQLGDAGTEDPDAFGGTAEYDYWLSATILIRPEGFFETIDLTKFEKHHAIKIAKGEVTGDLTNPVVTLNNSAFLKQLVDEVTLTGGVPNDFVVSNLPATKATLVCGTAGALANFQSVLDGSFSININNVVSEVNNLYFGPSFDAISGISGRNADVLTTNANGGLITEDGNQIWFLNSSLNKIYYATLSTPYLPSSAGTYSSIYLSTSIKPFSLCTGNGDQYLYISDEINDKVFRITLPTPGDASSLSAHQAPSDSFAKNNIKGFKISKDGTKCWYSYYGNLNYIYQSDLSTPWLVSSMTNETYYDATTQVNNAGGYSIVGTEISPDGTKFYILVHKYSTTATIYDYTLSNPWDITSASYSSTSGNLEVTGYYNVYSLNLVEDSGTFYLVYSVDDNSPGNQVVRYTIPTTASDNNSIASTIQSGIRTATGGKETVSYDTDHYVVTTDTAGKQSTIKFLSAPSSGTDISGTSYLNGQIAGTAVATNGSFDYTTATSIPYKIVAWGPQGFLTCGVSGSLSALQTISDGSFNIVSDSNHLTVGESEILSGEVLFRNCVTVSSSVFESRSASTIGMYFRTPSRCVKITRVLLYCRAEVASSAWNASIRIYNANQTTGIPVPGLVASSDVVTLDSIGTAVDWKEFIFTGGVTLSPDTLYGVMAYSNAGVTNQTLQVLSTLDPVKEGPYSGSYYGVKTTNGGASFSAQSFNLAIKIYGEEDLNKLAFQGHFSTDAGAHYNESNSTSISNTSTWRSVSFTAVSKSVDRVYISGYSYNGGNWDVVASIRNDDGSGKPTGADIGGITGLTNYSAFSTVANVLTEVILSEPVSLTPGQVYHICIRITNYTGGTFKLQNASRSGVCSSADAGTIWSSIITGPSVFVCRGEKSFGEIASNIEEAIRTQSGKNETVSYNTDHFEITSKASTSLMTSPPTGTDISGPLYLNGATNGVVSTLDSIEVETTIPFLTDQYDNYIAAWWDDADATAQTLEAASGSSIGVVGTAVQNRTAVNGTYNYEFDIMEIVSGSYEYQFRISDIVNNSYNYQFSIVNNVTSGYEYKFNLGALFEPLTTVDPLDLEYPVTEYVLMTSDMVVTVSANSLLIREIVSEISNGEMINSVSIDRIIKKNKLTETTGEWSGSEKTFKNIY